MDAKGNNPTVATVATVEPDFPAGPRELTIRPRRTGYKHRPIVVYHDRVATLNGATVNLYSYAASADPSIIVTADPGDLLDTLRDRFMDDPAWTYQLVQSVNDRVTVTRLVRFGYRPEHKKRQALHVVWSPADMLRDSVRLLLPNNREALTRFAYDVQDWLRENDMPVPTSFSGIAAALTRDKRFYPYMRGRVPKATNERLREHLPGVYQESYSTPGTTHSHIVAFDQTRAYHRAAQEISVPDGTTLYARGYFGDPEHSPIWITPDSPNFELVLSMPGLLCVQAISRHTRKNEYRPESVNYSGERKIYLWSSEIEFVRSNDVTITGIVAAWTAHDVDTGLPLYGAFAENEISKASEHRKRWLKPTLHAVYGLLAARERGFKIGWRTARGERKTWLLGPREIPVAEISFPDTQPATVNVAALGVLQAAIRTRTFQMANTLAQAGMTVTHIHADGLHAIGTDMPLIDNQHWHWEARTNLTYWDKVSWTSDQGDTLPGRDIRQRISQRRHNANILRGARVRSKTR